MNETPNCPDCGRPIASEGWTEEVCPHCLLKMAVAESTDQEPEAGLDTGAPTEINAHQNIAHGQVLGNRYGIRALLGRGGMGEVWRAFDLKLRVDVALKSVRVDLEQQERLLEALRQEVKAAREVASPNICRVYDLEELDGRELVSMEYIDGSTLREVLVTRGPLEIQEAQEIAAQLLAGLEAIHDAGLVHRDLKPENVMITPMNRVVVMDFGIAKNLTEEMTGTIAGTPAYMAPEQARGEAVDPRTDIFSTGVVLAEMLAPDGIKRREAREALIHGLRQEPPQVPDSPWREIISQAVAQNAEQRFASASTLARALEEVSLRVAGAEDKRPYPGLAAFAEDDAEFFFGRELEAEALWKKLKLPHMLALIGPSGAGKTSFLRAGLFANKPGGWGHVIFTPGSSPMTALREALVPALSTDGEAMRELVRVEDPEAFVSAVSRWRQQSRRALLVVDQFEELFTLNPPDVQAAFSELLGRLAVETDIRVLLSMRDDFLFSCYGHEALKPILSELTLIGPPAGAALRRAVVQPALKCGYRFEDERLVDEMISEVEGERGALPMLAFAAGQLWDRRHRGHGVLTREAFEVIGGVEGALAQHAELTLEKIGTERAPVVREIFRNLVTSQGTRSASDRNELLSVFKGADRQAASQVLDELINARLLTTYSVEATDGTTKAQQRIEIVHESLLAAWPRLVRWQAQDVDGARLRDDLRQAARRWQERDRSDDLLWTGSAFDEYQLWRDRYQGRLSEIEQAFADAMESVAHRRRRRRRSIVAGILVVSVAVAATTTALWRRSVLQTRRAEAAKLLTLGQAALSSNRNDALALTIASLQKMDTDEARRFAVEALWDGPTVTVVDNQGAEPWGLGFSSDGSLLGAGDWNGGVRLFHGNGGAAASLQAFENGGIIGVVAFDRSGRFLMASGAPRDAGRTGGIRMETHLWSVPDFTPLRTLPGMGLLDSSSGSVVTIDLELPNDLPPGSPFQGAVQRWPLGGGEPEMLGSVESTSWPTLDPSGQWLAARFGAEVRLHNIEKLDDPRIISRQGAGFDFNACPVFDPTSRRVAFCDADGSISIWPRNGDGTNALRQLKAPSGNAMWTGFNHDGGQLAVVDVSGATVWDLAGPHSVEPLRLEGRGGSQVSGGAFHPNGRWFATAGGGYGVALWNLGGPRSMVFPGHEAGARRLAFAPDGRFLYSIGLAGRLSSWALASADQSNEGTLLEPPMQWGWGVAPDPNGKFVIAMLRTGSWRVPLGGGEPERLDGLPQTPYGPRLDPTGRFVATSPFDPGAGSTRTAVVLDLLTGEQRIFDPEGEGMVTGYIFDPSGHLLVTRGARLFKWDHRTGATEVIVDGLPALQGSSHGDDLVLSPDGSKALLVLDNHTPAIVDLENGTMQLLPTHAPCLSVAFDPSGDLVVSGGADSVVRVGPVSGEEPHLLFGHEGAVVDVAVSPFDGAIAVVGTVDGRIHLWPMPDVSKPPLHTQDYPALMSTLEVFTNLRAIPDSSADTGYRIGPLPTTNPGWQQAQKW